MSATSAPAATSGGGSYGKSSGGGSSNPAPMVANQPAGSAPATGGTGKTAVGQSPFQGSYGASPDSLAAASIGNDQGANFFTGVANNAPGGAYGATQQATDQVNSANQLQQQGQAGIGSAAQNATGVANLGNTGAQALQTGQAGLQSASGPQDLYNNYMSALTGATNLYNQSAPAQNNLSPEQSAQMAAQTGLFNSNIGPATTPNPQPPAMVADLTPQNLYNQYASTLFGQPATAYTPNFAGTAGGPLPVVSGAAGRLALPPQNVISDLLPSPEQSALMAAQTGLFNSNTGPATTPAPFNGVSTAPATVRPQPPVAPAPVPQFGSGLNNTAPRPQARPAPIARPAPVVRAPAPMARPAPVMTPARQAQVQPVLRTAPRPPR